MQRSGKGGSHIKKIGVFIGNFEKNPLERPRSCFVGGSVVFSPLRATNAQPPRKFQFLLWGGGGKCGHFLDMHDALKNTAKAPAVHLKVPKPLF